MDEAQEQKPHLYIEYDEKSQGFRWKVNGNIPVPLLVGTLELIKSMYLDMQKMQIAQQQAQGAPQIVLPNGPINRMRGV